MLLPRLQLTSVTWAISNQFEVDNQFYGFKCQKYKIISALNFNVFSISNFFDRYLN